MQFSVKVQSYIILFFSSFFAKILCYFFAKFMKVAPSLIYEKGLDNILNDSYVFFTNLCILATRLKLIEAGNQTASMTGGLVQEFEHTVLPSISPLVTLILSAVSMLVSYKYVSNLSATYTPTLRGSIILELP